MRDCRVSITNSGTGQIERMAQNLMSGDWVDGKAPNVSTPVVKPGDTKEFASEEGGLFEGNEGWVLFKTFYPENIGDARAAFFRIHWDLPLIPNPEGNHGTFINTYRYDPRTTPGSQFDDKDKTPPGLIIRIGGGPEGKADSWSEAWPYFFVPIGPPGVIIGSNTDISISLDVLNTCEPGYRMPPPPFSTESKKKGIPEVMTRTNASMWKGNWSGDNINARITALDDDTLRITVTKVDGKPSEQTVNIRRMTMSKYKVPDSPQLSKLAAQSKYVSTPYGLARLDDDPPQALLASEVMVEINHAGAEGYVSELTPRSKDHAAVLAHNAELVSGLLEDKIQVGGDYVELVPDAVLEIYKFVWRGEIVDIGLRYRSPTRILSLGTRYRIDEMLHYYPDLD